jgi:hypothetical protein
VGLGTARREGLGLWLKKRGRSRWRKLGCGGGDGWLGSRVAESCSFRRAETMSARILRSASATKRR